MMVISTLLLAEPGTVLTKDGTAYQGDIHEDEQNVTVVIRGVETVIPRADIESIKYQSDYANEFRKRLAALEATDIKGRIALSREAFDQRRYDLAREGLNDALRIDPNNREATDLLDLVERQIRLERAGAGAPPAGAPPRAPVTRPAAAPRRVLSAEDINTIRQKELRSSDTAVRITFQGDVKRRFADKENMPFTEFNRLPPLQQAFQIIDDGDEQMRQQVRIVSDPSAITEYKRLVQPLILSNCATAACHGGPAGGKFQLYAPADSDAVTYTNFYILTQYARGAEGPNSGGVFGGSSRRLIERGAGDRSLLANYGLPVTVAEYDHPDVGGKPIQPIFRNKQDPRYEQIVNWMNKTLTPVWPTFGIEFPLPGAATTQAAPR
jgi:hypothetical protein